MKKNKQKREDMMSEKKEKELLQELNEDNELKHSEPNGEQTDNSIEVEVLEPFEEKLNKLQTEYAALNDKLLRTAAEFDNFRRRSATEKSNWIKYATERLILELCDVLDNFERALHQNDEKQNEKSFRKGIELIYKQLNELLKKEGVRKIDALHQDFDPQYHEALARIPSDKEENLIVAIIQNGYVMNEKVIRPVRVAVSNGEAPKENKKKDKKKNKVGGYNE